MNDFSVRVNSILKARKGNILSYSVYKTLIFITKRVVFKSIHKKECSLKKLFTIYEIIYLNNIFKSKCKQQNMII